MVQPIHASLAKDILGSGGSNVPGRDLRMEIDNKKHAIRGMNAANQNSLALVASNSKIIAAINNGGKTASLLASGLKFEQGQLAQLKLISSQGEREYKKISPALQKQFDMETKFDQITRFKVLEKPYYVNNLLQFKQWKLDVKNAVLEKQYRHMVDKKQLDILGIIAEKIGLVKHGKSSNPLDIVLGAFAGAAKIAYRGLAIGVGALIKNIMSGESIKSGIGGLGTALGAVGGFLLKGGPLGILIKGIAILGTSFAASKFGSLLTEENFQLVADKAVSGANKIYDIVSDFATSIDVKGLLDSGSKRISEIYDSAKITINEQIDAYQRVGFQQYITNIWDNNKYLLDYAGKKISDLYDGANKFIDGQVNTYTAAGSFQGYITNIFDSTVLALSGALSSISNYLGGTEFANKIKENMTAENIKTLTTIAYDSSINMLKSGLMTVSNFVSGPSATPDQDKSKSIGSLVLSTALDLSWTAIKFAFSTIGSGLLSIGQYAADKLSGVPIVIGALAPILEPISQVFKYIGGSLTILKDNIYIYANSFRTFEQSFRTMQEIVNPVTGTIELVAKNIETTGFFASKTMSLFQVIGDAVRPFEGAFKLIGSAGELLGKIAWPLQVVFSIFDFFSGFNNAADNLHIDKDKITTMQKIGGGIGGIISGLLDFPIKAINWLGQGLFGDSFEITSGQDIGNAVGGWLAKLFTPNQKFPNIMGTLVEGLYFLPITAVNWLGKKLFGDSFSIGSPEELGAAVAKSVENAFSFVSDTISLFEKMANEIGNFFVKLYHKATDWIPTFKVFSELPPEQNKAIMEGASQLGIGSNFIPPQAKGGAFSGNVIPFADGGIVSGPTNFGIGGTNATGLVGEAGPEAIMPLQRDIKGRMGVSVADFYKFKDKAIIIGNAAIDAGQSTIQGIQNNTNPLMNKMTNTASSIGSSVSNTWHDASGRVSDFIQKILPGAQEASKQTGIPVEAIIGQAGLETGWGKSAPGNNLFGIKADSSWTGKTQTLPTREVINGQSQMVDQVFRAYDDISDSIKDHVKFLQDNSRYTKAGVFDAKTPEAYGVALQKAGYATDPNYGSAVAGAANTVRNSLGTAGTYVANTASNVASSVGSGFNKVKESVEGSDHKAIIGNALGALGVPQSGIDRIIATAENQTKGIFTAAPLSAAFEHGHANGILGQESPSSYMQIPAPDRTQYIPPNRIPSDDTPNEHIIKPNDKQSYNFPPVSTTPTIDSIPIIIDNMGLILINSRLLDA